MHKLTEVGSPRAVTRHKSAKFRLPLNRLLEAKVLNERSPRGRAMRRQLFPKVLGD